ncbi:hypothetical protein B0A49_07748 [Cryomyces minteri]|uniref:Ubiquinone biosynthesis protein n=1 Tax=Cryomyces minteri TaxID=331657 RepID=A0A4U0WHE7_9PEZI|nr:hypothetical protein B0A49_07748 [Cryomyces minteri]
MAAPTTSIRLTRTALPTASRALARPFPPALRAYHSYEHDPTPPYPPTETAILSDALTHLPTHGFTHESLRLGARDAGYLDVSTQLFPKGAFELVRYHLVRERLDLKERVQFPDNGGKSLGMGSKIRTLVLERLRANEPVVHRLQEALALMSLASNIPPSIAELARLSDEMWFLAGDTSVDTSWYTKRASLSSVYAATEVFMTQDKSAGFAETEQFLDRRLADLRTIGGAVGSVSQWVGYTGWSAINVLRSKGMRM